MAIIVDTISAHSTGNLDGSVNKVYIGIICLVAAFGGLLFGFDLVIISGAIPFLSTHFGLNDLSQGFAVGCINLGAAAGALIAGLTCDVFGRRKFLIVCALLFVITGIGTGWSDNFTGFIIFRMCSGAAMGGAALVSPMYIAEIAPASYRGRLVAFYQLAIVTGLLLAYISNYLLLDAGVNNWRWMFTSQAVPAGLFFAGLFFVPESPRWLVKKNRLTDAARVLTRMGGEAYSDFELATIRDSFAPVLKISRDETHDEIHNEQRKNNHSGIWEKGLRKILVIGTMIAVFSQIVGINSVMSYAPEILSHTGIGAKSAFAQSVLIGLVFFVFTFIAISSVDKQGRRRLLLAGSSLLCISLAGVSVCFALHMTKGYWVLGFLLAFIATYSATIGPITWVMLSEIFPNRVRGNAMGIATLALWIANFLTTASFPIMRGAFGLAITFAIHSLICLLYFLFARRNVPETRGRSLEEMEGLLTGKNQSNEN